MYINTHGKNIRMIDQILEPVANRNEEHRRNQIRRAKLLGEQKDFIDHGFRQLPSSDKEKALNQGYDPKTILNPRYLTPQEAKSLKYDDGGTKLIKPASQGITANMKTIRPDLSKEPIMEKISEQNAVNAKIREARRIKELEAARKK